jgi:hypothetical protein
MDCNTPRSENQAPKVQASAFPEPDEDLDVSLDDIVKGDAKERCHHHCNRDCDIDTTTVAFTSSHDTWCNKVSVRRSATSAVGPSVTEEGD